MSCLIIVNLVGQRKRHCSAHVACEVVNANVEEQPLVDDVSSVGSGDGELECGGVEHGVLESDIPSLSVLGFGAPVMEDTVSRSMIDRIASRASPGPETSKALYQWPDTLVEDLQKVPHMFDRFVSNLRGGIYLTTRFSGFDAPGLALHYIETVLGNRDVHTGCGVINWSSLDMSRTCRKILCTHPSPFHVFRTLDELLPEPVRNQLRRLRPSKDASQDQQSACARAAMTLFKMEHRNCFGRDTKAWCAQHQGECYVYGAEDQSLTINVSGSVCVAYSRRQRSVRRGHKHFDSFSAFLIYIHERLITRELLILHECVPAFPLALLMFFLGDAYDLLWSIVVGPDFLGRPMLRARRYTLLMRKGSFVFASSCTDFLHMFGRACTTNASYFMVMNEEDLEKEKKHFAEQRCVGYYKGMDWRDILTTSQRSRLDIYQFMEESELLNASAFDASEERMWDLNSNYPFGPKGPAASKMGTLCTKFTMYSKLKQRPLMSQEAMGAMGFNLFDEYEMYGTDATVEKLRNLAWTSLNHISGNSCVAWVPLDNE